MASASKDSTVIVWDTRKCLPIYSLTSHTMSVTCIRWGGQNLLYTGSQDRTIKVWEGMFEKKMKKKKREMNWK